MCNVEDSEDHPTETRSRSTSFDSNFKFDEKTKSRTKSECVKCGQPSVLVTRIHDPFCKNCFQVYVVHKFRSAIGKSKLIRDGESVLVAFSGGTNSSALLHLIQDGLSLRAHKRLRFTPTLLHVDESCVLVERTDEVNQKRKQIQETMLKSGFPSYWIQLEQSLKISTAQASVTANDTVSKNEESCEGLQLNYLGKDPDSTLLPEDPSEEDSTKLLDMIKNFKSPTAQEDFFLNLRTQLMAVAAKQLGFSKILTAESSTRLAVRILSDVAQGRGSQLSLDTGISDERNPSVMFMRPVRELNAKELAIYNNLFGVTSVFMPKLTTKTVMTTSIERLSETFVTGLQADFPSTVSNIVRTSAKLGAPDVKRSDKCSFCQSPLDTNVGNNSALGAVLFSQHMSRPTVNNSGDERAETVQSSSFTNSINIPNINTNSLKETMCYGCRLTLHAFDGEVAMLPTFISERALPNIQARQRDMLSGFLLEENAK